MADLEQGDSDRSSLAPTAAARRPQASDSRAPRKQSPSWLSRITDDIHLSRADMPILACCAVSGLCDSVAFNAAGVFVSMQTGASFTVKEYIAQRNVARTNAPTGNTIFLALGASSLPAGQPFLWVKALSSIAAYWIGCFVFSKSRHFHPQRKATLSISFLIQAIFIFAAAALAQSHAVADFALASLGSGNVVKPSDHPIVVLPLALLAFQFGGQIVTSRVLGFNEVPTNVLTSVYCDLLSDPALLAPFHKNPKRNRRLAAAVLLVAGGISGGWVQRSRAGMSLALWIAGGIKFIIAFAWIAWPSRQVERREEKNKNDA